MVRNLMQDIVPPDKRSIKRIPVQEIRGRKTPPPGPAPLPVRPERKIHVGNGAEERPRFSIPEDSRPPVREKPSEDRYAPSLPYVREEYNPEMREEKPSRSQSSKSLWIVALISIVILFFAFSYFFSGASVAVTPREQTTTVNEALTARKNAAEGLSYDVMTVSRVGDKAIPATGKQEVQKKSSGTIIIYNNESPSAQTLVTNTRFETPDGLIYRISKDVSVPGQKTEAGKTVPGSIEAVVFADKPGEKYNIGNVDFTIPGFKGDPKFKTIYARSKTPMTGGFVGTMNAVEAKTMESTRVALRDELTKVLVSEAKAQKPTQFITFDTLFSPTYESLPETNAADGTSVTIHEKVTLSVVLLPVTAVSQALAGDVPLGTSGLSITNPDALEASLSSNADSINQGTITFTVKGAPHFVWNINEENIKKALSNTSKKTLNEMLTKYPEILKANATFRPFWRTSFPDESEISITIEKPESGQ
jgi:hypothetical protein